MTADSALRVVEEHELQKGRFLSPAVASACMAASL
jgi:hypothetical protein